MKTSNIILPSPKEQIINISWKVKVNDPVYKDQVIATYIKEKGHENLICQETGKLLKTFTLEEIKNQECGTIQVCDHNDTFHNICVVCNAKISITSQEKRISLIHSQPGLQIKEDIAKNIYSESKNKLLSQKKLYLVLDLDKTLINTTHNPFFSETLDVHKFKLKDNTNLDHIVKVRPYTKEFLEKSHDLFELHVFTHGSREYAEKIVGILDPKKTLFHDRIITMNEIKDRHRKSLRNIFPSIDSDSILIIDDNPRVWEEHIDNLIQIKPFEYFEKESNLPGDPDKDTQLLVIGSLLERIHFNYFQSKRHIHDLLQEEKESVFDGLHICFSGMLNNLKKPEEQYIWKKAKEFGAICHDKLDPEVTHLVVDKIGSEKYLQAQKTPWVFIVHSSWFFNSIEDFKKKSEMDYLMYKEGVKLPIKDHYKLSTIEDFHEKCESFIQRLYEIHLTLLKDKIFEEEEEEEIKDDEIINLDDITPENPVFDIDNVSNPTSEDSLDLERELNDFQEDENDEEDREIDYD